MAEPNITTVNGRRCTRVRRASSTANPFLPSSAIAPQAFSTALAPIGDSDNEPLLITPSSSLPAGALVQPASIPASSFPEPTAGPDIVSVSDATPSAPAALTATTRATAPPAPALLPTSTDGSVPPAIVITPLAESSVLAPLPPPPASPVVPVVPLVSTDQAFQPSVTDLLSAPSNTAVPIPVGGAGVSSNGEPIQGQAAQDFTGRQQQLPAAAIAGGVIGSLVGAALLSILVVFCIRSRGKLWSKLAIAKPKWPLGRKGQDGSISPDRATISSPIMQHARKASRSLDAIGAAITPNFLKRNQPGGPGGPEMSSSRLEDGMGSRFLEKDPYPSSNARNAPGTSYTDPSIRSTGPLTRPWARRDREENPRPTGTPFTDSVENPFGATEDPFRDPENPLQLRLINPDDSRAQTPQTASTAVRGSSDTSPKPSNTSSPFNPFKGLSNYAAAAVSSRPTSSHRRQSRSLQTPTRRLSRLSYEYSDPFADPVPADPNATGADGTRKQDSWGINPDQFPVPPSAVPPTATSSRYPSLAPRTNQGPTTAMGGGPLGNLDLGKTWTGTGDDLFTGSEKPGDVNGRQSNKGFTFLESPGPVFTPRTPMTGRTGGRRTRGVSDPFDLDRPEILGYGGMGRGGLDSNQPGIPKRSGSKNRYGS